MKFSEKTLYFKISDLKGMRSFKQSNIEHLSSPSCVKYILIVETFQLRGEIDGERQFILVFWVYTFQVKEVFSNNVRLSYMGAIQQKYNKTRI